MNTKDKLNEAAEKYYWSLPSISHSRKKDIIDAFNSGVKSDAAKQYWQEQLQLNNKQGAVDVESWYRKWMELKGKSGIATINVLDMLKDYATKSPTISFSEDEIEKMAEKEFELGVSWSRASVIELRIAYAKGFKAALQQKSVGVDKK